MALVHEFVTIEELPDKDILDIYDDVKSGKIKNKAVLKIADDVIRKIMVYRQGNNLIPEIQFNYWGISVFKREDQMKWMRFIKVYSLKARKGNKKYYYELQKLMMKAYANNEIVLHFGI